jgi:formate dehydrogenase maturation protein FdhE
MNSYPEIAEALRQGGKRHPELADTIDLYCALLEIQEQAQVSPRQLTLTAAEARARLDQGEPLMAPDEVEADSAALTEMCFRIAFAIAERRRDRVNVLARIHAWFHERQRETGALAANYLRNGHLPAVGRGIDQGLLAFVFAAGLRPFLRARAEELAPLVDDGAWYRPHCPVCGGQPDMAALEKDSGRRRLLCSRCDHEWTFRRLGCAFCPNEDAAQLAHYPTDDNVYRLAVCEQCRRYLKTIDLREAAGERYLAAERILSVGLDAAAEEAGYRGGP